MINLNVWVKLIRNLYICQSENQSDSLVEALNSVRGGPKILSFVNAHAAMLGLSDESFASNLLVSNYLLRDGIGVKLLLMANGVAPGLNMNGSDFIPTLIRSYGCNRRIALLGTRANTLSVIRMDLESKGYQHVTVLDGFQNDDEYLNHIQNYRPELVILAMGMPKQERVARKISEHFPSEDLLIVNGGAVLDFMSGHVARAPVLLRKIGLEWLYRFLKEPRRMFYRNVGAVFFCTMFIGTVGSSERVWQ